MVSEKKKSKYTNHLCPNPGIILEFNCFNNSAFGQRKIWIKSRMVSLVLARLIYVETGLSRGEEGGIVSAVRKNVFESTRKKLTLNRLIL